MKLQTLQFGGFACCAAVLLGLLIPATTFWVHGYWLTDDIQWEQPSRFTRFRTSGGGCWLETRPLPGDRTRTTWQQFDAAHYPFEANETSSVFQRCGFLFSTQGYDFLIVLPYWSLVGTLTVLLFLCVVMICKISARGEGS